MRQSIWMAHVVALALALCTGCGRDSDKPKGDGKTPLAKGGPSSPDQDVPGQTVPEPPGKVEPPPPPSIPDVVMAKAMRSTFLVWVGDALPEGELPDLEGKARPLRELFGKKLSIVVFWNSKGLYGLQELQDLAKDVAPRHPGEDLAVLAVNVGDSAEAARKVLPQDAAGLTVLLDPEGAYFAKVAKEADKLATDLLPRTYALDAEGKVLWLDAGYSESTARGINMTIQVVLGDKGT